MQLGPVRFSVDPKGRAGLRPFAHRLIACDTEFSVDPDRDPSIQELYAALASSDTRNRLILDDLIRAIRGGRSPILLTERTDHLRYLADRLAAIVRHVVVLQGGMSAVQRRGIQDQLEAIPETEERVVLATGRYIGEGFDDARLDTLFLALPVSWKGTLIQYTGRLHRPHPGKTQVQIFDYVDRKVPVLLRMFGRRLRGYRAIGYLEDGTAAGHASAGIQSIAAGSSRAARLDERRC